MSKQILVVILVLFMLSNEIQSKQYGIYYTAQYPQIADSGKSIIMNNNNRVTLLSTSSSQNPKKSDYAYFSMAGKTISYDIDLSTAGCGCNIALYQVDLHALSDDSRHYCDANNGDGTWCPENDIMEANTNGFHITPHCCCQNGCNGTPGDACLTSVQSRYNTCDQWGYAGGWGGSHSESFDQQNPYGPGKYIDTTKPFHFSQTYTDSSIKTTLSQNGKSTSVTHGKQQQYLQKFKPFLQNGMAIIISLWSGGMGWLDGGEGGCTQENCQLQNVHVKISNVVIAGEQITFQQSSEEVQEIQ